MFSAIKSWRDVLRFSDQKTGESEGVTWIEENILSCAFFAETGNDKSKVSAIIPGGMALIGIPGQG